MAVSVKTGSLVILLFLCMALAAPSAQGQIGLAAGYGLHVLNSPSFSSAAQNTFESPGGVNLGLFYDFRFGQVTLRPGMFLRQGDFEWTSDSWKPEENPLESSLRVVEIPIDLLYHFRLPSVSPYVVAGPVFSFFSSDYHDLRISLDNPKGTTSYMGISVGAGIELAPSGLGIILFPEIRYSHALSGFMKEEYTVRTIPFASDAQRLSSLTFRLGISLPTPSY